MRKFHVANSLEAGYLFHDQETADEVWDLASYTQQCGRRGDSLHLALGWIYYGQEGYGRQIDQAFETAKYLSSVIREADDFILISHNPPPCVQVCFYSVPDKRLHLEAQKNTELTQRIVKDLVPMGFMVDYAPGGRGSFLRVVVNRQTRKETVDNLVETIRQVSVRNLNED